jgi:hypothetical protein
MIKQQPPTTLPIVDGTTGEKHNLVVTHDFHGVAIAVEGYKRSVILKLSDNVLEVFALDLAKDTYRKIELPMKTPV